MNTSAAPNHLTKVPLLWPPTHVAAKNALLLDAAANQKWSYATIFQLIEFFGDVCQNLNITNKKPVVSIIVRDRTDQAIACLMGLFNAVVINPINPDLRATELDVLLTKAKPDLILSDDHGVYEGMEKYLCLSMATLKNAAIGQTVGTDIITQAEFFTARELCGDLLIYTSGDKRQPKGVCLSAKNIHHNVQTACRNLGFYPGIRTLSMLPLFRTFSLFNDLLTALYCGGSCVIAPVFDKRTSAIIAASTNSFQVNAFSGIPMIFETLASCPVKLSTSIRFAVSASAPLADSVRHKYQAQHNHTLIPCYNMSEAGCFVSISPKGKIKAGSSGKPVGLEVQILDDEGEPLGPNTRGEIAILGESVIGTYFREGGADDEFFTKHGWLRTGDIGYLDEEGYLFIIGRKKTRMIAEGKKVYLPSMKQCLIQDHLLQDVNNFCNIQ